MPKHFDWFFGRYDRITFPFRKLYRSYHVNDSEAKLDLKPNLTGLYRNFFDTSFYFIILFCRSNRRSLAIVFVLFASVQYIGNNSKKNNNNNNEHTNDGFKNIFFFDFLHSIPPVYVTRKPAKTRTTTLAVHTYIRPLGGTYRGACTLPMQRGGLARAAGGFEKKRNSKNIIVGSAHYPLGTRGLMSSFVSETPCIL